MTNTGPTIVTGDLGVFPGPSVTGFAIPPANTVVEGPGSTGLVGGPGLVNGTIYISHAVADQAQVDTTTAYLGLQAMPFTSNRTGQDLGGQTLTSGVYHFDTSAQLTGTLTLGAEGNDNAFWVFQIGSTLTTASASTVQVINAGPNGGSDIGVYWQVGSSATLGTSTSFQGNILALASITLDTTATILCGRALAQTGAVTLDTNTISNIFPIDGPGGPACSGGLEFDDDGDVVPLALATKSGIKYEYEDVNFSGDYEPGTDTLLANWTIYAYNDNGTTPGELDAGDTLVASTITNANGQYSFTLAPGDYIIVEELRPDWLQSQPTTDVNGGTQGRAENGYAISLLSGQVHTDNDFGNYRRNVIVIGAGKSPRTPQFVTVLDASSGEVLAQFAPYGNTFQGGIRVATGDLTGDGVDEIVTAPGWSIVAEVRVYTQAGELLTSFQPYGPSFNNGVNVAVADVDGDGLNDIITVPSWGPAEVKVFRNVLVGGVPTFDGLNPYRQFLAFPSSFIGGVVVAAADMGQFVGGTFANTLDGKAEIVLGSGAGAALKTISRTIMNANLMEFSLMSY